MEQWRLGTRRPQPPANYTGSVFTAARSRPPPFRRPTRGSPTRQCSTCPRPITPRSHDRAVTNFVVVYHLDADSTFHQRQEDPRVAAIVMARGSLASARYPSAAITARYPSVRATLAALDSPLSHPSTPAPIIAAPPPVPPTLGARREGSLHRTVRDAALALLRAALIAHPESVRDVDRQQRTALHIAADEWHAILAVYLLDARADPNARDKQGFTPIDCVEYRAARNAARAPACLSTLAVLFCFNAKRSRADEVADPPSYTLVHQRLADTARRMTLIVPWLDEPWASAGAPERQPTPTPAITDAIGPHTLSTAPPTTDRDSLRPPLCHCAPDSQAPSWILRLTQLNWHRST